MNSRWNGQFLGSFWSREKKSRKLAGTSRRPNVAKSQRSEVGSTRRGSQQVANVATPQRCDASTNSVSTSLKAKGPKIEGGGGGGIGKRKDEGTKSIAAAT